VLLHIAAASVVVDAGAALAIAAVQAGPVTIPGLIGAPRRDYLLSCTSRAPHVARSTGKGRLRPYAFPHRSARLQRISSEPADALVVQPIGCRPTRAVVRTFGSATGLHQQLPALRVGSDGKAEVIEVLPPAGLVEIRLKSFRRRPPRNREA